MYGASRKTPWGLPVDLDQLLLSDQLSRQLSPTALRNQSAGGGFFEGTISSPIRELIDPSPRIASGLTAPVGVSRAAPPTGLPKPGIGVGR